MSHSIFSSPLSRAIPHLPLSRSLPRLNSTLALPNGPRNVIRRVPLGTDRRKTLPGNRKIYPTDLLTLLQSLGHACDIPEYGRRKMDLSFVDPLTFTPGRKRHVRRLPKRWDEMSLKGITEAYLYHFYYVGAGGLEDLDALDRVFREDVVRYLAGRGYCPEDVLVWAWILTAGDGEEAGLRIDMWSRIGVNMGVEREGGLEKGLEKENREDREDKDGKEDITTGTSLTGSINQLPKPGDPIYTQTQDITRTTPPQPITRSPQIPPFVILFNLRRPTATLNVRTLNILLPHIHQTLSSPLPSNSQDDKTPLLIIIRLLRHARSSWPAAIPMCADLISTHIHPPNSPPAPSPRLTRTYNRLLSLFSYPTHDHPFKYNSLHQRAQFILLRKMASLDIPITREGYRALIVVQLAHPKTPTEALHASSLSKNWPPWPAPKDGHHRSPGHTHHDTHLSRAGQVLRQMTEAGYSHLGWEQEALVLAGTDTDSSPTIQTLSLYHRDRNRTYEEPRNIWAVRVRATRTLEEAWSIFLDCMNTTTTPAPEVWEEMFCKIISARKEQRYLESRQRKLEKIKAVYEASDTSSQEVAQGLDRWDLIQRELEERRKRVLPGDAREVRLSPVSPSEGVYVEIPPPCVEELFMMMKRVCKTGKMSKSLVAMLVGESESVEAGDFILKEWSKAQFKRLMKSVATSEMIETSLSKNRIYRRSEAFMDYNILTQYLRLLLSTSIPTTSTPTTDRTDLSIRLLIGQSPRYPPAWNTVLHGLTYSLLSHRLPITERQKRAVAIWRLYKASQTTNVPTNTETLRILCTAAERTLSLSTPIENEGEEPTWRPIKWDNVEPTEKVIRLFSNTVFTTAHPPLLMPDLAMLHAYVRLLGFTGRYSEIMGVLRWMRKEHVDLDCIMGRRVLMACKLFLSSVDEKEVTGVVSGWVEWPEDAEVRRYVSRGWKR